MTDDQLFGLANLASLAGWLALLLAPLARARLVAVARFVAAALAAGYAVGVAASLVWGRGPAPDLMTLSGLAAAFSQPRVMLLGWAHYLAFDLWVGAWETEEAGRRGLSHAALIPCLALTFVAGPIGLLLFLLLRTVLGARPKVGSSTSGRGAPTAADPYVQ